MANPPPVKWPGDKAFAFSVVDDTDNSTIANVKPVYDLLQVPAADQEEADGDFVHGEREDQERRSDDGELEVGNGGCARSCAAA